MTVRRRDFLVAGVSAVAAAALEQKTSAQPAADIRAFGTPEGSYKIRDTVAETFERPSIDAIDLATGRASVWGRLFGKAGTTGFRLNFEAVSAAHLRFEIKAEDDPNINRIRLRSASSSGEAFFGFGEQLTYFNQKGKVLPILVQEHGVGRGRPILTQLIDIFADGGGRNPYVTEAPAPHFISSRLRSLFLENTQYSVFDMRSATHFQIKVWSGTMTGRILYGETPLDLIEAYTEYAGRMRVLPDWVHNGVIVASQGGMQAATKKLAELRQASVPLAGFWIQDWVGIRVTSAGQQLCGTGGSTRIIVRNGVSWSPIWKKTAPACSSTSIPSLATPPAMMRCSRKRKQTAIWSRKQTVRPTSSKTPTFLPR